MEQCVQINSRLYARLFEVGGDNLIAVYSMLKFAKKDKNNKDSIKIYKEQNRNIYHTLKDKTKLSVTTLRKYIKVLQNLNLCKFDTNGNFVMLGNNKINILYKKGKTKTVPVQIGNYTQTKIFSVRVRILTMEQAQKNQIDRRDKRSNIIARVEKGYFLSKQESRQIKNLTEKDKFYLNNRQTFTAKTVLSNLGFSKLKNGATKSKSSGNYWKTKLIGANIITVKRNFKYIKKCSQKEYLSLRYAGFRKLVYKNGRLFEESPSEFSTDLDKFKPKNIEPLKHLSFDMIAWWAGQ